MPRWQETVLVVVEIALALFFHVDEWQDITLVHRDLLRYLELPAHLFLDVENPEFVSLGSARMHRAKGNHYSRLFHYWWERSAK